MGIRLGLKTVSNNIPNPHSWVEMEVRAKDPTKAEELVKFASAFGVNGWIV